MSKAIQYDFKKIVEASPVAMLIADTDGRITFMNTAASKLFGYKEEELLGKPVERLVPIDSAKHQDYRSSYMNNPVKKEMGAGRDLIGLAKDGKPVPIEVGLTPLDTKEGIHVLACAVDISDRIEANRNFESIVNTSPTAMITVNNEGTITFVNTKTLDMFEYQMSELVGQKIEILVPDSLSKKDHVSYRQKYMNNPKRREMGSGRDLVGRTKSNREIPIEVALNPISIEGEVHILASAVDISERIEGTRAREKYVKEVEYANKMLQRSNQDLDEFAYIASHDLKSPLRAIDNLSLWIEEDLENPPEEVSENLNTLRARVSRMENLLEDLLEYSRIGRMNETLSAVDSRDLIEAIAESLDIPKDFRVEIGEDLPILRAPRAPLDLVFRNLIGNSIKHRKSDDGHVFISCERVGNFYFFTIRDNGKGIAPEFHNKAFQLFQTLQSRDEIEGTGIGLAIVKKAVNRYGGIINLSSDVNMGASFTFSWPINIQEKDANADQNSVDSCR